MRKNEQFRMAVEALLAQDMLISRLPEGDMERVLKRYGERLGIPYRIMIAAYRRYSKVVDRPWCFE